MLHHIRYETITGRGFAWKKTALTRSYKEWEYLYNELYILLTKRQVSRRTSKFLQISEVTYSKTYRTLLLEIRYVIQHLSMNHKIDRTTDRNFFTSESKSCENYDFVDNIIDISVLQTIS